MGQSKPFRPTAIVVEDDEIEREMLALLLEESDFEVIQCEDAETASLALEIWHTSLLITDVDLTGDMDGIELAHLARQHAPDMRVLVISGNSLKTTLPDGVTSKPVYPTTLLQKALRRPFKCDGEAHRAAG
jgi:two-component system, cell cycle response regulator CpdR